MQGRKISIKDSYQPVEAHLLGEGAFSRVYTVENKFNRKKFALKKVNSKDRQIQAEQKRQALS